MSALIPAQAPRLQTHLDANQRFALKMSGSAHLEDPANKLAWVVVDAKGREWAVLDAKDIGDNKVVGLTIVKSDQADSPKSLKEKALFLNQFVFGGVHQQPKKLFMTEWFLVNCKAINARLGSKVINEALVDANVSRRAPPPPIPPHPKAEQVEKPLEIVLPPPAAQKPVSAVAALRAKFEQPVDAS